MWSMVALLQCAVLVAALRSKLFRSLPNFVLFVGFAALQTIFLILVSQYASYGVYFYGFYAGISIESVLLVLVIHEFFKTVFEPRKTLPSGAIAKLVATIIGVLVIAVASALWKPVTSHFESIVSFLRTCHRTAEFTVCCSLWAVVLYARALGIPWRSRVADIASGFLVYLTVQSVTTTAMGFVGQPWGTRLSEIGSLSYLAALVIWIAAFRRQEHSLELPSPNELLTLKTLWAKVSSGNADLQSSRSKANTWT